MAKLDHEGNEVISLEEAMRQGYSVDELTMQRVRAAHPQLVEVVLMKSSGDAFLKVRRLDGRRDLFRKLEKSGHAAERHG